MNMKNLKNYFRTTVIFCMALVFFTGANAQQRIVGYMPSWAGDANAIQYSKLSHINYSFALPLSDGSIKPIDNPGKLQTIVSKAHAQGTKVLIAVGGWSDGGVLLDPTFETLAANATSRTRFVNACMSIVNTYNLDGVDIDWEYPDAGQSATNFDLLMTALSAQLKPQGKLLTAAVIGNGTQANGIPSSSFSKIDFLNVMSYDANNFQHSTFDYALQCLNYWTGRGMAKGKISLGVPFYGRPSWESYAQLVGRGANPNLDVFGNVGYNGINTIKQKTQYVKDNGFGGMMIWEISQDLNNQNSLLSAMYSVLGSVTPPPPPATRSPFGGIRWSIPGKIEAENYDNGGQNIAYNDNTSGNSGNSYRSENVDIEPCTDAGAGFNVGYIAAGEWLEYSVNVTANAAFKLEVRVAAITTGKSFHVELNGVNISGSIPVPNTGGWQNWQTVSVNTSSITSGQKTLRIVFDTDGLNLNHVTFSNITTPPPTNQLPTVSLTSPSNNATYTQGASINLTANASDADGSIARVEFYQGSTLLNSDNTAPYSFTWTNAAAGTYSITARAFDNTGASRTSSAVIITVNPTNTGGCNVSAWTTTAIYTGGMRASRNGTIYEAKWWTQGNDPLTNSGQWDVWKIIGACSARMGEFAETSTIESQNIIGISPNPTNGIMRVTLQSNTNWAEVNLYNFNGEKVFSQSGLSDGALVDFQSLPQGVYFLKMNVDGHQYSSKVIKQ